MLVSYSRCGTAHEVFLVLWIASAQGEIVALPDALYDQWLGAPFTATS